ncbi:unnamed protein product [Paramecium sonneborni]|uniref:Uncharacterized protein n=1 Tax=Paramecium sonneborni TaxID=65129 RepID=A0A8S1MVU7_9CILI|nr:unnamed protein product [Paramecium sonneborni]
MNSQIPIFLFSKQMHIFLENNLCHNLHGFTTSQEIVKYEKICLLNIYHPKYDHPPILQNQTIITYLSIEKYLKVPKFIWFPQLKMFNQQIGIFLRKYFFYFQNYQNSLNQKIV